MSHPGDYGFSGPLLYGNHGGSSHGTAANRDGMDGDRLGHYFLHARISWSKRKKGTNRPAEFLFVFDLLIVTTPTSTGQFLFVGIGGAQDPELLTGLGNCRTRRPNTLGNDPPPQLYLHPPERTCGGNLSGKACIAGGEKGPPIRWRQLLAAFTDKGIPCAQFHNSLIFLYHRFDS